MSLLRYKNIRFVELVGNGTVGAMEFCTKDLGVKARIGRVQFCAKMAGYTELSKRVDCTKNSISFQNDAKPGTRFDV